MRLIFARHGETTGDVENRYGGAYDDHLSTEGLLQAQNLAEELRGKGITTVFCSPLARAVETAQKLVAAPILEPRVRERNQYGPLTGMVKAEAKALYPDIVEGLKDRMFVAPDAESYDDFRARIEAAFADFAREDCDKIIVWHGGGMRVLFRHILALGELKHIGDCCWVELESMPEGGWKIGNYRRLEFDF